MVRKPRPLNLTRNACDPPVAAGDSHHASCDEWECDIDGEGSYACGRTVAVPAVVFDESDGKQLRRLAEWLQGAADWVESKPLAGKKR